MFAAQGKLSAECRARKITPLHGSKHLATSRNVHFRECPDGGRMPEGNHNLRASRAL
ncbi:hypothetical protein [Prevotella nigrescens]|uniref:hypothetical protein n=1 Tax=Prevotella nigrescens TaxID=28133 RepID=UPI00241D45FB|nr:hypothetical protein [Prevotella nigrescens]